jgi:hypothetical protein
MQRAAVRRGLDPVKDINWVLAEAADWRFLNELKRELKG